MDEKRLSDIETAIGDADASAAGAIAFAAICRIGEHGREAGDAFALLANDAPDDADIGPNFIEGCAQIEEAVTVAIA